jgi:hypothetical protein
VQEEICQLKSLLDAAYQELYGQPAMPTLASDTNDPAVAIDFDPKLAADAVEGRLQQRSRVMLQPCLTNSKN